MQDREVWESRYSVAEYVFGTEPNAFLALQRERLPVRGQALSVADGEGRNGVWLAEQGLDVLSLDFSPAAQAKAEALARERGVTITTELADVTTWTYPAQAFDVVVMIFAQFQAPAERERVFAALAETLRPGGLLLIEGYTPRQAAYKSSGAIPLENFYTRELLEAAFRHFSSVEIREYDAELNEGTRHRGMSALIDLVAVK